MHKRVADKKRQVSSLQSLRDALETEEFKVFERNRTGFNIFKALGVGDYEIRHSNMLAWLMDPHEKHNLGDRFLKGLLAKIIEANSKKDYECLKKLTDDDFATCRISREEENRDIQIEFFDTNVVLVIENKWNAGESEGTEENDGQLKKYQRSIDSQFDKSWGKVFVFLTPEGRLPSAKNQVRWGVLGYGAIREIITGLLEEDSLAGKMEIKNFVEHYLKIIEERLCVMTQKEKNLCEKIYKDHHEAIKLVEKYHFELQERLAGKLRKGIVLKNCKLECCNKRNADTYIQYDRRFPSDSSKSVHYEVIIPNDDSAFVYVAFHVESETDASIKDQLLAEVRKVADADDSLLKCGCGAKVKVVWLPQRLSETYSKICEKMQLLYDTFEPIIAKYEKRK